METPKLKIVVSLVNDNSDYQVAQAKAAQESARKHGFGIEIVYAQGDAITQSQQLLKFIQSPAASRPNIIIFEPVGTGLMQVAQAAVKAGIGWVVMNREVDYVTQLRGLVKMPVFAVSNNHLDIGRIQARQLNELLPNGGSVIYILGPTVTDAAQLRSKGMMEIKHANIEVRTLHGRWTEQSGFDAVSSWLRLSTSRDAVVHVVAAQNDFMAMGAHKAIAAVIDDSNREKWQHVKFLGVDGLAEHGMTWVRSKLLVATVITPTISDIAIEMIAKAVATGTQPAARTYCEATSYPPLGQLSAVHDAALA